MPIKFSKHAIERIRARKISRARVLETIKKPDKTRSSFRSRKLFQKKYGGKILEVAVKKEDKNLIVITAYYLGI